MGKLIFSAGIFTGSPRIRFTLLHVLPPRNCHVLILTSLTFDKSLRRLSPFQLGKLNNCGHVSKSDKFGLTKAQDLLIFPQVQTPNFTTLKLLETLDSTGHLRGHMHPEAARVIEKTIDEDGNGNSSSEKTFIGNIRKDISSNAVMSLGRPSTILSVFYRGCCVDYSDDGTKKVDRTITRVSYASGNTSNMSAHLRRHHPASVSGSRTAEQDDLNFTTLITKNTYMDMDTYAIF
ncbi:hypothetical protein F2P81_001893 [Scophthalmus maximus]|uniref:Uncharacterized protein n=1 Tax=Scophthalmus maximus TaxID=52904 RepID=A0A6A4TQ67_SCOMX|nr:hypothetical protein F2P81_001893 [Scophthalmus maximus]